MIFPLTFRQAQAFGFVLCWGTLGSAALWPVQAHADDQTNSVQHFREQYPKAAQKLRAGLNNIHCKARGKVSGKNQQASFFYEYDAQYYIKGKSRLFVHEYDAQHRRPNIGVSFVQCLTPEHAFRLDKAESGIPFVIKQFSKDQKTLTGIGEVNSMAGKLDNRVFASVCVLHVPLEDLLADSQFVVTGFSSASPIERQETIELVFEYKGTSEKHRFGSGKVRLLPSLGWAVASYSVTFRTNPDRRGYEGITEGSTEYQRLRPN